MPNAALTSMLLEADSGDDLATGGDSGGPVFTFGGALGLIHCCVGTIVSCGSRVAAQWNLRNRLNDPR